MGQFGNQPDFGTIAGLVVPQSDPTDPLGTIRLNSAALYIGTGGTLVCRVVGGNAQSVDEDNAQTGFTIFKNIPDGTFFPVIVDCVWNNDGDAIATTCSDIIALY